jgi:hypothetical protein
MLPDNIDERNMRSASVVQVSEAIAKAWAEMKQGAGGLPSQARITVSSPGNNAFEETQNATNFRPPVKRRNNVHFRSAGICEAGIDSSGNQCSNQTFRSVHRFNASKSLCSELTYETKKMPPAWPRVSGVKIKMLLKRTILRFISV